MKLQMKKENIKQIKGITLVSLVITIVIMLILAGVAISLVIGDNGLFKKSKSAANTYQAAAKDEESQINNFDYDSLLGTEEGNKEEVIDRTSGTLNKEQVVTVPLMTSNSSSFGECFGTPAVRPVDYEIYYAFDEDRSTFEGGNLANTEYAYKGTGPAYIGYKFNDPVEVFKFEIVQRRLAGEGFCNLTLYYSDDGTNYYTASKTYNNLLYNGTAIQSFDANTSLGAHKYWKVSTSSGRTSNGGLSYLQFYGYGLYK